MHITVKVIKKKKKNYDNIGYSFYDHMYNCKNHIIIKRVRDLSNL